MRDYVGRQDVLVLLDKIERRTPDSKEWMCQEARFEILNMPPADVQEVVHGHWVWNPDAVDWNLGAWVCSKCRRRNDNLPNNENIIPYLWAGHRYCSNCGAKMDEGKYEN